VLIEEALIFLECADVISVLLEPIQVGGSARFFGYGVSFEDALQGLVGGP
jgi:hypothetical protein